jgi:hypothetical protein
MRVEVNRRLWGNRYSQGLEANPRKKAGQFSHAGYRAGDENGKRGCVGELRAVLPHSLVFHSSNGVVVGEAES